MTTFNPNGPFLTYPLMKPMPYTFTSYEEVFEQCLAGTKEYPYIECAGGQKMATEQQIRNIAENEAKRKWETKDMLCVEKYAYKNWQHFLDTKHEVETDVRFVRWYKDPHEYWNE